MDLDNMNCEVEEVGMGKFILIWPTHIFGMEDSCGVSLIYQWNHVFL